MRPLLEPPLSGEIELTILAPPASQQSRRSEKERFGDLIRSQLGQCQFLLLGDVVADIEWLVHEQRRYESNEAPDVDNILKPLLDTLCGPQGLIVDDCQIQAVSCRWIDSPSPDNECVQIRLRFRPDEWLSKSGFCFVHLGKGLCFPTTRNAQPRAVLFIVEQVNVMLATRNKLIELGADYYTANGVMSVQRVFHRSRVGRFDVIEIDSLRAELKQEIADQPSCPDDKNLDRAIRDLCTPLDNINTRRSPKPDTKAPRDAAPAPKSPGDDSIS